MIHIEERNIHPAAAATTTTTTTTRTTGATTTRTSSTNRHNFVAYPTTPNKVCKMAPEATTLRSSEISTKSSTGIHVDTNENCVCGWKNCATYQRAFHECQHAVFDGFVVLQLEKSDANAMALKDAIDKCLKVPASKRSESAWKKVKGKNVMEYSIARHHYTEQHILKYLENPDKYSFVKPLASQHEAELLLFEIDSKQKTASGQFLQIPNVSKEHVKELFLQLKHAVAKTKERITQAIEKQQDSPNSPIIIKRVKSSRPELASSTTSAASVSSKSITSKSTVKTSKTTTKPAAIESLDEPTAHASNATSKKVRKVRERLPRGPAVKSTILKKPYMIVPCSKILETLPREIQWSSHLTED